jgi:hypothetical protein
MNVEFQVPAGQTQTVYFAAGGTATGVMSVTIAEHSLQATLRLGTVGKRNDTVNETLTLAQGQTVFVSANRIEVSAPENGFVKGNVTFISALNCE